MGKGSAAVIKRADWILIAAVLAAAAGLYGWSRVNRRAGIQAVVTVDGREAARYDLAKDIDDRIETPYGWNRILIRDGTVEVAEADCPDRVCVREGRIQWCGQTIVCLPHRLVVSVEGSGEPELDGWAE